MTTTILVIQVLLAFIFLMMGAMKVFMQDKARAKMEVLQKYPRSFVTFIGVAEMAGALGITLPIWFNIFPALAVHAAGGLGIIMLGALHAHITRKEYPQLMMALLFLVALIYIALAFI